MGIRRYSFIREKILRSKVFDIKRDEKGNFIKYKARLVACGYTQQHGIDFFDTYAPVVNTKSFRILLVLYNQIQK